MKGICKEMQVCRVKKERGKRFLDQRKRLTNDTSTSYDGLKNRGEKSEQRKRTRGNRIDPTIDV